MKRALLIVLALSFLNVGVAQNEKCGTIELLNKMLQERPVLQQKIDSLQQIRNSIVHNNVLAAEPSGGGLPKPMSWLGCIYNNSPYTTLAVPTSIGPVVSAPDVYGGEYVTLTGLVAGYTYNINTCSGSSFDTQITIYPAGGGTAIAYNDDYCGSQSRIYFTPFTSGSDFVAWLIQGIIIYWMSNVELCRYFN